MSEEALDGPLDHVLRTDPPWRESGAMTECGRRANDVASVLTADEVRAKAKKLGKQRLAMTSCMTCINRFRSETWEQDPVSIISRYQYGENRDQLERELRALTLLWREHADEFREALQGLGNVQELRPRRRRG